MRLGPISLIRPIHALSICMIRRASIYLITRLGRSVLAVFG
ncbi:Uncharacterised protein [Vibrio cholerae]|nr:Uncharacterised protein [Vibrio cholerae]